jgi:hypothetical protein
LLENLCCLGAKIHSRYKKVTAFLVKEVNRMITTAIIYNIGRGLAFNVILPLWYVANQIIGM